MPKDRLWRAVATIEVGDEGAGPFVLGTGGAVTIGRSEGAGLRSPSLRIEMPRELARLRCTKSGWILENEGMTVGRKPRPVKVKGPEIAAPGGAVFSPHAWVLMSSGEWTLEWDVGVLVKISLRPLEPGDEALSDAVDLPRRNAAAATIRPEYVDLNESQRRNMTALFAYRILDKPQPKDIYAVAARLLDPNPETRSVTRNRLKAQLPKLQNRLNRLRGKGNALSTADDVGRYLVDLTGTLGPEDLEDMDGLEDK